MCAGDDYEGVFETPVLIADGSYSGTIRLVIIDDELAEGVETLSVELVATSPLQNISISTNIEIVDNEG